MNIDSRVFLITGGASGLGAATVRMLVAAGGRVAIADLNRAAGEALAAELGLAARFIATDVADEASGPYLNGEVIRLDGAIRIGAK